MAPSPVREGRRLPPYVSFVKCLVCCPDHGAKAAIGQPQDKETGGSPVPPRLGGSRTDQNSQDQPQIVAGDMDQVAFVDVVAAAQPGPAHAAAVEGERAKLRSTSSARSLKACRATPDRSRARLL